MALANVIAPPLQVEDGTTNISNIKYKRYGNVVNVYIYNLAMPDSSIEITGLPKPANNHYEIARLTSGSTIVGWIEYTSNNKWMYGKYANGTAYTTFCYICED